MWGTMDPVGRVTLRAWGSQSKRWIGIVEALEQGGIMGFVSWIVLGLVFGIVAKLVRGFRGLGDWVACLCLGIAGAALGGLIYSLFGVWGALQEIRPGSAIVAGAAAALVLVGYRLAERQPRWGGTAGSRARPRRA